MRYREFYESDKGWPKSLSKEHYDIWPKLQEECSEIIKVYSETKKFLYRGFKGGGRDQFYFKSEARKDRIPLDTPIQVHNIIDKVLTDLKIPVLRRNSYFATSDKDHAFFYGKVYLMFPINGYNYLWFKDSADLFKIQEPIFKILRDNKDKYGRLNDKVFQEIKEIVLQEKPIFNEGIHDAIEKQREIMFTGSYYAVSPSYFEDYLGNKIFH